MKIRLPHRWTNTHIHTHFIQLEPNEIIRLICQSPACGFQRKKNGGMTEGKKKDRQWPWQWEAQQFKKDVASQSRPRWQSAGHRRDAIDKINQFPHCINAHDFSMASVVKILDTDTILTVCMCVCGMWKLHLSKRRKTSDWCQTNPPLHST